MFQRDTSARQIHSPEWITQQKAKTCLWFGLSKGISSCMDFRKREKMCTHINVLGCQRCQWGLKMRVDRHTLYSSNGQADGRLLCSLCLGWWLYSSGCSSSLQPCTRVAIYRALLSPRTSLCCSLSLLFICTFFVLVCTLSIFFSFLFFVQSVLVSVCLAPKGLFNSS